MFMIWYDIFVNCSWVDTRWQKYSTYLHTNNTYNDTKQIYRTQQLEECGPCPVLASYTLAFALQPRKKHGQTSVMVVLAFQIDRQAHWPKMCQVIYLLYPLTKHSVMDFWEKTRITHNKECNLQSTASQPKECDTVNKFSKYTSHSKIINLRYCFKKMNNERGENRNYKF